MKHLIKYLCVLMIFISIFSLISCGQKAELGSKKKPIKMYFVPSMETGKIITNGQKIADYLTTETGYHFKVAVPTSYAAVIEAMGTKECDIAWLATFAYILANQKFGAQVALTTVRKGLKQYRGQFVVRADSNIKKLTDINGKIIAYTDAASASGYIYPSALLAANDIIPKRSFFVGGHPQAILAVYQGTADIGCSYWSPDDENGNPQDARQSVLETYPDIMEKVKPIAFTDWIPNDTITFRKNFSPEMREKIVQALLDFAERDSGKEVLKNLFSINGFVLANDKDYDVVRTTLKTLGMEASQYIK